MCEMLLELYLTVHTTGLCCCEQRNFACSDVNECLNNNGGCDSKRTCANTAGGRICGDCPSGYVNNGTTDCAG